MITLLTALQIATNRSDLTILILTEDEKFGMCIARGLGHSYIPLLSTPSNIFESKEKAIDYAVEILKACREAAMAEMESRPASFVGSMLNPHSVPYDESACLSETDITKIKDALLEGKNVVETLKILDPF